MLQIWTLLRNEILVVSAQNAKIAEKVLTKIVKYQVAGVIFE